jgi:hypothetical protein
MSQTHLRLVILAVAGLEFAPMAWLLVRICLEETDWSSPYAYEAFWIPGILSLPSLLALVLAASGRGLAWAVGLCIAYAAICLFFVTIARVATIAG